MKTCEGHGWRSITGSGRIVLGECLVHQILFYPSANVAYVLIYDGRDATVGRFFTAIICYYKYTQCFDFGEGVYFAGGVYVESENAADRTTIVYTPLG